MLAFRSSARPFEIREWCRVLFVLLLLRTVGMNVARCEDVESADSRKPLFLVLPFDRLTLTSLHDGKTFDVQPIEFPGGVRPDPLPRSGELTVRFVDDPSKEMIVQWNHVEKIELFREMVRAEFRGELDSFVERVRDAVPSDDDWKILATRCDLLFDYLRFLDGSKNEWNEYAASFRLFLYSEAVYRIKAGDFTTGFARFEQLFQSDKNYPGLEKTWGDALEIVLKKESDAGRFSACRRFLDRFLEFYPNHESARNREKNLLETTRDLIDRSKKSFAEKKYFEAHRLCEEAGNISPALPEWTEWRRELQAAAPRINVAVTVPMGPINSLESTTLPDWASERCRSLLCRMLCEYDRPGPEGGIYRSNRAGLEKSDKNRVLRWDFTDSKEIDFRNAVETLSKYRKSSDKPGEVRFPASVISSIETPGPNRLEVRFRRSMLVPEAIFSVPVVAATFRNVLTPLLASEDDVPENPVAFQPGPFFRQHTDSGPDVFCTTAESDGAPALVFEYPTVRSEDAVRRIRSGEVDLIDRLPPWRVDELKRDPRWIVGRYAAPSVYFLVPNADKPLPANRTFRRALLYGLNRSGMLEKLVSEKEGNVSSAPWIRGASLGDPFGYAYDTSIRPRPYEPKLAMALSTLAFNQVRDRTPGWEKVVAMPELVLARPNHEIAEYVALMIRRQWAAIGISVRIVEYRDHRTIGRSEDVDFWLVDRNVREPIVDVHRIFGAGALSGKASPYMELALEKLLLAEDWPTAARRLYEIHRLCFEETTVLPLWQLPEYYVYRFDLQGMRPEGNVHLYQHLSDWRLER